MSTILITGANGNVGAEVIKALTLGGQKTIAGVSSLHGLNSFSNSEARVCNFMDAATWEPALDGVDKVFLMRPPAISNVKTFIFPFIDLALKKGVKQIVFLSLQGVSYNPLTPHFKIEKYLRRKKAPFTFLRPNFFMQNLTTVYKNDITHNDEIYLPAGNGKTAFIDVRDIGEAARKVLCTDGHISKAYTLSGSESLDYFQVADILSQELKRKIEYKNPSVKQYEQRLKSQGTSDDYIKVQKMLYFVVRHNFSAATSPELEILIGHAPTTFRQFAKDHAAVWKKP